ncbi:MAG: hypothetical protein KDI06_12810 [Calditrichaeota bacterium]|nr:hypothetical protein [Calditrichota bacterium]HQU73810.1 hypothetical protein [Calditrichia bacterium]
MKIPLLLVAICLWAGNFLLAQPNLQIHGYLSQAYAQASDYPIFGIPVSGTTDYRNLALQFRVNTNKKTSLIFQLSHKRLGKSPIMVLEEDVELDWGFFEYRFSENGYLRAGLLQLPFGIYNEIRDVGILLPFYQVPYTPYGEGNYTSETINGVSVGYEQQLGDSWRLSGDIYLGEWMMQEWFILRSPLNPGETIPVIGEPRISHGFGAQLWLETPVNGLRLGSGGYFGQISGGVVFQALGKNDLKARGLSIDGDFEKFLARLEVAYLNLTPVSTGAWAVNSQVGWHLLEKLSLMSEYCSYRVNNIPLTTQQIVDESQLKFFEEVAVGINFRMLHNFVFKLEHHWTDSYITEIPSDIPGTYLQARKTRYAIFSVSMAF